MIRGYYVIDVLRPDGMSSGKYGPYTVAEVRELLRKLCDRLDYKTIEHAIEITQQEPGTSFDLTDFREVNGVEYLAWSARLTWRRILTTKRR